MFRGSISLAEPHFYCPVFPQGEGNVIVNQTDISIRAQHNIGGFNISVKNAVGRLAVKIVQRLQELTGPPNNLGLRSNLPLFQQFIQTFTVNKIHNGVHRIIFLYKIIDLRNIGMA